MNELNLLSQFLLLE